MMLFKPKKVAFCEILLVMALATLLYSCGDADEKVVVSEKSIEKATEKPSFVIVLCDVSSSISTKTNTDPQQYFKMIGALKRNCSDLIRSYPAKSVINLYVISENATPLPFATVDCEEVFQTNSLIVLKNLAKKEVEINRKLDSAALKPEPNTCILTSLQNAYNEIEKKGSDQSNENSYNYEIVLFSDLLEQCNNSPVGNINMNKGKEFLTSSEYRRLTNYSTNIDFSRYNIKLTIYMTSEMTRSKEAKTLDSTWRIILNTYGYKIDKNANTIWNVNPNFKVLADYKSQTRKF